MVSIAIVGCTGKLGSMIMKNILNRDDVVLKYAIARKGNEFVGESISKIIGGKHELKIMDDICMASECDVFIDCTHAETFISDSIQKYEKMNKPVVIATTGFNEHDLDELNSLAGNIPVFRTGNFSIALHDFIETLKFAVQRVSEDTDIQIVEYHHNQKKDAPSGTALMIRDSLVKANERLTAEMIHICSVRGGNIFGEHEVIFANCKDEVTTYRHQVSSRETFADGAIEVAKWMANQNVGMYDMDDFCGDN